MSSNAPQTPAAAAAAEAPAAGAGSAAAAAGTKKKSVNWQVSEGLMSVSVVVVGDNPALNWATAQSLAKRIGWFPVHTSKVLCGMLKADSVQQLMERDGRDAVAKAEAQVLKGLRSQRRCCVATLGDGAGTLPEVYGDLYGSIIVWLDESDRRTPKPKSAVRTQWHAAADLRVVIPISTGFARRGRTPEERAKEVVGPLVKQLAEMLEEDAALPARKLAYGEMGFRGDWPQLMPPEWNPVMDRMGAAAPAAQAASSEAIAAATKAASQEGKQQQ